MADANINELRALRRKARTAIAKAEEALGELRGLDHTMESVINRLLNSSQDRRPDASPRERTGPLRKRVCDVLFAAGAAPGGIWTPLEQIAEELPEIPMKALVRSLDSAVESLVENEGDAYRLLENGLKLAQRIGS